MQSVIFENERKDIVDAFLKLQDMSAEMLSSDDLKKIRVIMFDAVNKGILNRGTFDLNPILFDIQTAIITAQEIGLSRASIIGTLLHDCVALGCTTIDDVEKDFGKEVAQIIKGLIKINELYSKNPSIETENFRDLLLSFAEDMRVIFIIIADRVNLMRQIKDKGSESERRNVALEASRLYAPLAHKLGLYLLKSELEDLSLKYLEHDAYYMIKEKLNATKKTRDEYIHNFITPIEDKLSQVGLHFHVKGRTKSIHSIWQKMKKQQCEFSGVYDLFAIRIILDSPLKEEKEQCWKVFTLITAKYESSLKRLRDWLTVPKSNGYESLHITVRGPQDKWVEVQIRTERMDEIAERGLAAHWRYKGIKSAGGVDNWLANIRLALETGDETLLKENLSSTSNNDVYVFSPKGDLYKMIAGATILDFAYHIHTNIGDHCVGARINGKVVPIRHVLESGTTVEIITQSSQTPKIEWLNYVATSHARSKIKSSVRDLQAKEGLMARELLERKLKNKKIDISMLLVLNLPEIMAESRRVRLPLTTLDEQAPYLTRCGACSSLVWSDSNPRQPEVGVGEDCQWQSFLNS